MYFQATDSDGQKWTEKFTFTCQTEDTWSDYFRSLVVGGCFVGPFQYVPLVVELQTGQANPVLHFSYPTNFKLLTKDSCDNPNASTSVVNDGDYIPADTDITASTLGLSSSVTSVTLYVKSMDSSFQGIGSAQVISVENIDTLITDPFARIISYD